MSEPESEIGDSASRGSVSEALQDRFEDTDNSSNL